MSWSNSIGGYLELELNNFGSLYHDNAVALNSGRNALEYILIQNKYDKIYLPYYTCDVTLQPIKRQNIDYEYYSIDEAFYPVNVDLKNTEALLYVNYFGIMNTHVQILFTNFHNLIIDNAQAFYEYPISNTPTFYSPRKFFGIPDGGFAYSNESSKLELDFDVSEDRILHLVRRIEKGAEAGYNDYKENENKLIDLPIKKMSLFTKKILHNIRFEDVRIKRYANFQYLHERLKFQNELTDIIEQSSYKSPLIYPFLKRNNYDLRKKLIENNIYTSMYWPNIKEWFKDKRSWEIYLFNNLISLPVDQRYSLDHLDKLIDFINNA